MCVYISHTVVHYIPYVPVLPYSLLNSIPLYSKFNDYDQWCAIMPWCNPIGLFLISVFLCYIFFLLHFLKSYLLDLNFMCPRCGIMYCIWALSVQMVNWSIEKHTLQSGTSFFIKLTTLNDEIIDIDLYLIQSVWSNIWPSLLIVFTAKCRR